MLLFIDEEFTGLRKDTTLISLGIVAEDGRKFYAEFIDYDQTQFNDWIIKNVIKNLYLPHLNATNGFEEIQQYKQNGYIVSNLPVVMGNLYYPYQKEDENQNIIVWGNQEWISEYLRKWLSKFDSVQFVSDVCHYDFVLLIDLITNGGTALNLPENISPVCHDLNMDIARHYGISEREAFNKSREEIVMELCGHEVEGKKHNALYDAEVIKRIYERIVHLSNINTFSDQKS